MQLPIFEKYIDELIEKSTLDVPAWNIEKAREGKAAGWNYIDGCMILALLEIYNATGEKKYYEFADAFIDHRVQEDGTITKYSVEEYNIDNVNAGKTLFALYALNGKEKYRKAIDLIYSQVETQPRTEEGNFWHKKIYPNQVWLDGMYMGQPFYMEYETKFDDKKHYDDIFHQFANVVKYMRDPKTGLYYHGYDASKKAFWCNKETGLSQNFWLRALGWYSMALLDTLSKCEPGEEYTAVADLLMNLDMENLPADYADLRDIFRESCYQAGESYYAAGQVYQAYPYYQEISDERRVKERLKEACYLVLGTWQDTEGNAYTFNLDGTCTLAGESLYFAVDGLTIRTGASADALTATHQLTGISATSAWLFDQRNGANVRIRLTKVEK